MTASAPVRPSPAFSGAGSRRLPGYNFSEALKQLDIVWTPETVSKLFEVGPMAYTPGTKMPEQQHRLARGPRRADAVSGEGDEAEMRSMTIEETTTLWRPVGPDELRLIEQSGMRAFPPRLPEQPIFYPVLSEEYAVKIARDWNVPATAPATSRAFACNAAFLRHTKSKRRADRRIESTGSPRKIFPRSMQLLVGEIEIIATFDA